MAFGALVGSARGAPVFAVSSTLDEPDATLDGNCVSTPSGLCTLRAAVQEANFAGTATVTVPAGLYVLTRNVVGTDDGSVGDLDIGLSTTDPTKSKAANVTIVGAGADRTIIDGNGSHRVVDIHDDLVDGRGVATISGVSIRDGQTLNDLDSVASHWHDLSRKVVAAARADGPAFLNVLTDCPIGWGHEPRLSPQVPRRTIHPRPTAGAALPIWPIPSAMASASSSSSAAATTRSQHHEPRAGQGPLGRHLIRSFPACLILAQSRGHARPRFTGSPVLTSDAADCHHDHTESRPDHHARP